MNTSPGTRPLRLLQTATDASGKEIHVQPVEGPFGVHPRHRSAGSAQRLDESRIKSLGWEATTSLHEGIAATDAWIEEQVEVARGWTRG